ncbi:hypothetical protein HG536_0D03370 [Torulaspora globosa]|uniref:Uncharacterized protein n=1 Tax=Torulaspora globosa TaxID=48254 RepID=A0A7G3ZH29_9SACH|nr:uncharacterized protein HG536_0D03370 [Torulaspora globosa]QLL32815.1 hypothetical protein HG536_0D03370 [Torulaspora globosa]
MSENRGSPSYGESFINLFGADSPLKSEDAGRDENGTVSQSDSAPPASLLAEGASMGHGMGDTDATPSILLEQLAYVDNFMSSLEQDYATLDSWIIGENQDSLGGMMGERSLALDERLATELSAFADDSFIFPDEDKRQQLGHGDGEGDCDGSDSDRGSGRDGGNESSGGGRSHFLTQRRNTFLTSQYDHSKSRFSSRRRRGKEQPNGGGPSDAGPRVPSPAQDHGGFVNVDITPNGSNAFFAPTVPSPLTNLVASQPYSVSNSPENVGIRRPSSTKEEPLPVAADRAPVIHMPDYSKIPTSTLVALLPKVAVPPGAYQALIKQGLGADQIDAIAVIIAHHEKEKQRQKGSEHVDRGAGSSGDSKIERSASFLFDILSNITQSRRPSQPSSDSSSVREKSPVRRGSSSMLSEMAEDGTAAQTGPLKRSADEITADSESAAEESRSLGKRKAPKPVPNSRAAQKLPLKRKIKETQLETSIHELSELATSLQQKIHTLETENEVLKKLVISSGELEGIEKAEKIKTELLKQLNEKQKKSDEPDGEPAASQNDTII